jgi:hypothetical protein
MKCLAIPVITGATGTVSKSLKNPETIPGQHASNITHHNENATI